MAEHSSAPFLAPLLTDGVITKFAILRNPPPDPGLDFVKLVGNFFCSVVRTPAYPIVKTVGDWVVGACVLLPKATDFSVTHHRLNPVKCDVAA